MGGREGGGTCGARDLTSCDETTSNDSTKISWSRNAMADRIGLGGPSRLGNRPLDKRRRFSVPFGDGLLQ
eukprot:5119788-Pyramimonas_sp.AAC.1